MNIVTVNGVPHLVRAQDDITGCVTTWCELVTGDAAVHRPGAEVPCHECVVAHNDQSRREQLRAAS